MVDCITDEPARGAIGDLRPFQTSGLEGARRLIRGELPGLPMSRLVGMRVTEYAGAIGPHGFDPHAWLAAIRKVVA